MLNHSPSPNASWTFTEQGDFIVKVWAEIHHPLNEYRKAGTAKLTWTILIML